MQLLFVVSTGATSESRPPPLLWNVLLSLPTWRHRRHNYVFRALAGCPVTSWEWPVGDVTRGPFIARIGVFRPETKAVRASRYNQPPHIGWMTPVAGANVLSLCPIRKRAFVVLVSIAFGGEDAVVVMAFRLRLFRQAHSARVPVLSTIGAGCDGFSCCGFGCWRYHIKAGENTRK